MTTPPRRTLRTAFLAATFVGVTVALVGCSLLPHAGGTAPNAGGSGPAGTSTGTGTGASSTGTVPDEQTTNPTGDDSDVFTLIIGDCLNDDTGTQGGEVSSVKKIDCSLPHDFEVHWDFPLTETEYPGDDVVGSEARTGCDEAGTSFIGLDVASSSLYFTEYTPTASSWATGDRIVTCIVGDPTGKTVGSLIDAAR